MLKFNVILNNTIKKSDKIYQLSFNYNLRIVRNTLQALYTH